MIFEREVKHFQILFSPQMLFFFFINWSWILNLLQWRSNIQWRHLKLFNESQESYGLILRWVYNIGRLLLCCLFSEFISSYLEEILTFFMETIPSYYSAQGLSEIDQHILVFWPATLIAQEIGVILFNYSW